LPLKTTSPKTARLRLSKKPRCRFLRSGKGYEADQWPTLETRAKCTVANDGTWSSSTAKVTIFGHMTPQGQFPTTNSDGHATAAGRHTKASRPSGA